MSGRLDGKVCVVTGGASGIGEATVRRFVAEGARVIFTDIQDDRGVILASETAADYRHQDVTDEAGWTALAAHITDTHGRLDVLVNNAGIFRGGTIETGDLGDWDLVMNVNLRSVMLGCRTAIRLMKKNPEGPSGSIVNVSSITGFVGLDSAVAYTASKGAVRLLTKSVGVHCARNYQTIRCNSVHPGAIDTPMNQAAFDASGSADAMRAMFNAVQPIGRMTTADEVVGGILYLASDDASSTNATELLIDGGWLAHPPNL